MKKREQLALWGLLLLVYVLWTLRVLFLSSPDSGNLISLLSNACIRTLIFLTPFFLLGKYYLKEPIQEAFALYRGTVTGWILALCYSFGIVIWELTHKIIMLSSNPSSYINLLFVSIIEELVFRGFIFTHLQKFTGKIETILITSLLFTLIQFPAWIFISELKGEPFLIITGQIFIFSLFQGVIRLYAKSILPNILVNLVNTILVASH